MNYWLTTHWPPFEDELDRIPEIEVKEDPIDLEDYADLLRKGDLVFVYKFKQGGEPYKDKDRIIHRIKAELNGIDAIFTVKSEGWLERDIIGRRFSKWYAELQKTKFQGFVPKVKVNEILGYKKITI